MSTISAFKYSCSTALHHLVTSVNEGVVSNGNRKNPIPAGTSVVVVSRTRDTNTSADGTVHVAIGIATGEIDSRDSGEVWDTWKDGQVVHNVKFFGKILVLPEEMHELAGRQAVTLWDAKTLFDWAIKQV